MLSALGKLCSAHSLGVLQYESLRQWQAGNPEYGFGFGGASGRCAADLIGGGSDSGMDREPVFMVVLIGVGAELGGCGV